MSVFQHSTIDKTRGCTPLKFNIYNIDTQNDAIFEGRYIFQRPIILGIYSSNFGCQSQNYRNTKIFSPINQMFLHKKIHPNEQVKLVPYGGFLKWWYPTTIGFPTKNDHFGVFWGYHHLRKHPYHSVDKFLEVAHFARKFLEMPISFGSRSSPPKIGSALKPQGEKSTSIPGVKLCFFFFRGGSP